MDKPSLNIVRGTDVAAHSQEFTHPWNPNSEMHGMQLARSVGLKRTGVNFIRVPAGKESYVYHSHQCEEEWIYVLSGRAIAFIDDAEYEVAAGDFLGFPAPSVAHLMRNPGPEDLVYLVGGESREFDVAEFPKLGKRMVRVGKQVDIYDAGDAQPFGPIPL
ncbi:MAG: cupin domain-containing protein [Pseudomonadota bacterium]